RSAYLHTGVMGVLAGFGRQAQSHGGCDTTSNLANTSWTHRRSEADSPEAGRTSCRGLHENCHPPCQWLEVYTVCLREIMASPGSIIWAPTQIRYTTR